MCTLTYIVAMQLYFSQLWQFRRLLCVATMSSLSYEFEIDTEKQRQYRCNDARLTESGNARSKQLLVMPTESLMAARRTLEWIGTFKGPTGY